MIKKTILLTIFVLMALPAFGEYFQYTDQNGNLRFTDDLSKVPEDQRKNIKTFESVQSLEILEPPESKSASVPEQTTDNSSPAEDSQEDNLYNLSKELNQKQEELSKTAASLREQQARLKAQKPAQNALHSEKTAHSEKIKALNAKIEEYNKNRDLLDERVEAFNKQLGYEKKSEKE